MTAKIELANLRRQRTALLNRVATIEDEIRAIEWAASPSVQTSAPPKSVGRVYADSGYELAAASQVRSWCETLGVTFFDWDDLQWVNIRRERAGLRPFARKFPTKGVRG